MQKQKTLQAAIDLVDLLKGGDFRSSWVERKSQDFEELAAELMLSKDAPCPDFIRQSIYNVVWLIPDGAAKLTRAAVAKAQSIGGVPWRELAPRPTIDEIIKSLENVISRLREPGEQLLLRVGLEDQTAEANGEEKQIPAEHLTKAISKAEAAKYLSGMKIANPTQYLRRLIEKGMLSEPIGSGKLWQFDVRQFPEKARGKLT